MRYATIRYGSNAGPDDQQVFLLAANTVILKNFGAVSFDLFEVCNLKNIKRFDIGDNRLENIDLEPLRACSELRYLDISGNRLQKIDLSPLRECRFLQRLDLSHNRLASIDLSPLNKMDHLKQLYLHANWLESIDMTPLIQCYNIEELTTYLNYGEPTVFIGHRVESKRGPKFYGDPLLEYALKFGRPSWLNGDDFRPLPPISSYKALVGKFGWPKIKRWTMSFSRMLGYTHAFPLQTILLKNLGIPELACYDGPLEDIINLIPENVGFQKGVQELSIGMIELLRNQLQNGGSTLFFDIDSMSSYDSSVLIPLLLERRKKEMKNIRLKRKNNLVNLLPLWTTGYGYEILKALGIGRTITIRDFYEIEEAFKNIGIRIKIEIESKDEDEGDSYNISESMINHILPSSN